MRVNEPITNREIELADDRVIVSKTDTAGRITFVNKDFIEVSGFTEEELLGKPHNLIRHPHMPKEAFADLWATIKAGDPWEGIVKNRAKSGDYYWVKANVTPMIEDGQTIGYISIRSKPGREQVAAAERIYERVRAGKAGDIRVKAGAVIPTTLSYRVSAAAASVTGRLVTAFSVMVLLMALVAWAGLAGMRDSNQSLGEVFSDRTVPAGQLGEIVDHMRDNLQQMTLLVLDLRDGAEQKAVDGRIATVRANIARITALWDSYSSRPMDQEEKALAQRFAEQRAAFVREGLEPALEMAKAGDSLRIETLFRTRLQPLFQQAQATNRELLQLQIKLADSAFKAADADFRFHLIAAIAVVLLAVVITIVAASLLLGVVKRQLRWLEVHFDRIASADLGHEIPAPSAGEFLHITNLLRAMRAKLAYSAQEREELDRRAVTERVKALEEMASRVESEAASAVETVSGRSGTMAADAQQMADIANRVSGNSQGVAAAAEEALANAQAVAAATGQLAASIDEIAGQVSTAGTVTRAAVEDSRHTQEVIDSLSQEIARIGEIATLINDIAGQTNLLALNATIEAARAGDAGKGFAVVASEVKNLANQTSRATDDIARQIGKIQSVTRDAVQAVSAVGQTIARVDEISTSISAAVEQQSAATREISRNVAETSAAARDVSKLIAEVSGDAAETGTQAVKVQSISGELAESVGDLRQILVRVVRTSTKEADRRLRERFSMDAPCILRIGGAEHHGRMRDISDQGGAKVTGMDLLPLGGIGVLLVREYGLEVTVIVRASAKNLTNLMFQDLDANASTIVSRLTKGASRLSR